MTLIKNEHLSSLVATGLSPTQATVYATLLVSGPSKAGTLIKKTPIKRGLLYKALDDLVTLGLVDKTATTGSSVAVFAPAHPTSLRAMTERRAQEARDAQTALDGALGALTSAYNLTSGKPDVEFYEGLEGFEKVLADSLAHADKEPILMYADIDAIDTSVAALNTAYVKKRLARKVPKRILVRDTPSARSVARAEQNAFTEYRIIADDDMPSFASAMNIYAHRVSYVTFAHGTLTGTIIHDPSIYQMHRALFDALWRKSRPVL